MEEKPSAAQLVELYLKNSLSKEGFVLRYEVEQNERWQEWSRHIPPIEFPAGWKVQVLPPSGGAMARFRVYYKEFWVSVYLDVYERLGFFGGPHWEMYPNSEGDNERFGLEDTKGLLDAIQKSFLERK